MTEVTIAEGQPEIPAVFKAVPGWTVERVDTKRFSAYETYPNPPALALAVTMRREHSEDRRRMAFRTRVDFDDPASVEAAHRRLRASAQAWMRQLADEEDSRP